MPSVCMDLVPAWAAPSEAGYMILGDGVYQQCCHSSLAHLQTRRAAFLLQVIAFLPPMPLKDANLPIDTITINFFYSRRAQGQH